MAEGERPDERPWEVLNSKYVLNDKWLKVRADDCRTADGVDISPYYVLEFPDWIGVIALTDDNEVVVIRQYRHGIKETILELPGGAIDAADASREAGVRRELQEETGYGVESLVEIGSLASNPVKYNNHVHFFIGKGARRISEPSPEPTEQIEVLLMPLDEVFEAAHRGDFPHPHHVSALFFATKYLG